MSQDWYDLYYKHCNTGDAVNKLTDAYPVTASYDVLNRRNKVVSAPVSFKDIPACEVEEFCEATGSMLTKYIKGKAAIAPMTVLRTGAGEDGIPVIKVSSMATTPEGHSVKALSLFVSKLTKESWTCDDDDDDDDDDDTVVWFTAETSLVDPRNTVYGGSCTLYASRICVYPVHHGEDFYGWEPDNLDVGMSYTTPGERIHVANNRFTTVGGTTSTYLMFRDAESLGYAHAVDWTDSWYLGVDTNTPAEAAMLGAGETGYSSETFINQRDAVVRWTDPDKAHKETCECVATCAWDFWLGQVEDPRQDPRWEWLYKEVTGKDGNTTLEDRYTDWTEHGVPVGSYFDPSNTGIGAESLGPGFLTLVSYQFYLGDVAWPFYGEGHKGVKLPTINTTADIRGNFGNSTKTVKHYSSLAAVETPEGCETPEPPGGSPEPERVFPVLGADLEMRDTTLSDDYVKDHKLVGSVVVQAHGDWATLNQADRALYANTEIDVHIYAKNIECESYAEVDSSKPIKTEVEEEDYLYLWRGVSDPGSTLEEDEIEASSSTWKMTPDSDTINGFTRYTTRISVREALYDGQFYLDKSWFSVSANHISRIMMVAIVPYKSPKELHKKTNGGLSPKIYWPPLEQE